MILTRRILLLTAGATLTLPGTLAAQEAPSLEEVHFDPDAPVLGNPEGDVTLVEYFDYQCPYCKALHPVVTDLVARDGNIRLILKDWPVFGAPSVFAAQLALGSVALGAYEAVSHALMETRGSLDFEAVMAVVGEVVNPEEALASYDAEGAKWDALLRRTHAQAEGFGFIGTPSFVIGTQIFPGVLERPGLEQAIREARA